MHHVGAGSRLVIGCATVNIKLASGAGDVQVSERFTRCDRIDHPTHCVRPVEQRCRTAHKFNTVQAIGVSPHTVIC